MDAYYDKEVINRTLRTRFSGGRRVTSRGQIITLLKTKLDVNELSAIYKTGDGEDWYLTFKDEAMVERLGDGVERKIDKDTKVTMERIDRRHVKFRIHWFPLHMKKELVEEYMGRFGTNVELEEDEMIYEGVKVKTGTLTGRMLSTEQQYNKIPYRGLVFNRHVLITVLGRQSVCLRCGEKGHQRATCPDKPSQRPRSYAAVTSGVQEQTTSSEGTHRSADVLGVPGSEGTQLSADVLGAVSNEGTGPSAEVLVSSQGSEGTMDSTDVLNSSEGTVHGTEVLVSGEDTRPSVDVPKRQREDEDGSGDDEDGQDGQEKKRKSEPTDETMDIEHVDSKVFLKLPLASSNDSGDPINIV